MNARDPLQAGDLESCLQWYRSELSDDFVPTLIFAMNSKPIAVADKPASFAAFVVVNRMEIPLPGDLHENLTDLFHAAESDLNPLNQLQG